MSRHRLWEGSAGRLLGGAAGHGGGARRAPFGRVRGAGGALADGFRHRGRPALRGHLRDGRPASARRRSERGGGGGGGVRGALAQAAPLAHVRRRLLQLLRLLGHVQLHAVSSFGPAPECVDPRRDAALPDVHRGIVIGPLAGKLAGRLGTGPTLMCGSVVFAAAIALTLVNSLLVVAVSLAGICAGFFGMHAAAVGSLNRRVAESRGRANSLYVLLYYLGGAAGISATGAAYVHAGWGGAVLLGIAGLLIPFGIGFFELRAARAG